MGNELQDLSKGTLGLLFGQFRRGKRFVHSVSKAQVQHGGDSEEMRSTRIESLLHLD